MKEKTKNLDDSIIYVTPLTDVVPVVHGHWILERKQNNKSPYLCFRCSVCGNGYRYIGAVDVRPSVHRQWEWFDENTGMPLDVATCDHCPNCKAKMDGDENG